MSENHHALLRILRSEFQAAKEKCGPFFHAILKMPPAPHLVAATGQLRIENARIAHAQMERVNAVLHALALGSLANPSVNPEMSRLMVASANNGETEWMILSTPRKSWSQTEELATRAFHCLPPKRQLREPYHEFLETPWFPADYNCRWMLFVYRRLAGSGSLVIQKRFTELEFNRRLSPFPLDSFDPNMIVTYLSVDAFLASAYAIDAELKEGAEPNRATEPDQVTATSSKGLSRTEQAVLSIIKSQPKGSGISGKEIVKKLKSKGIELSEPSLRKHILPKLRQTHGVANHRAAGGYLVP